MPQEKKDVENLQLSTLTDEEIAEAMWRSLDLTEVILQKKPEVRPIIYF